VIERYALYFAPAADSALARLGANWLGRDSVTGEPLQQPSIAGFSAPRLEEITADARCYGFHATLKPPFALAPGCSAAQLEQEIAAFALRQATIGGLSLEVGSLGGFLALMLTEDSSEVRNLAAACVREFDSFRLPPSEEELRRRQQHPLSDLEDALLRRWGYPYVMEAFRFHMTLTSRLSETDRDSLEPVLRQLFGRVANTSFTVDGISLFHQESREAPFRLICRYPFGGDTRCSISTNASTDRASGPSFTSVKTSPPST
jgi:putative phosphonate metabolism protein